MNGKQILNDYEEQDFNLFHNFAKSYHADIAFMAIKGGWGTDT